MLLFGSAQSMEVYHLFPSLCLLRLQHCFTFQLFYIKDCKREALYECYANILLLTGFSVSHLLRTLSVL